MRYHVDMHPMGMTMTVMAIPGNTGILHNACSAFIEQVPMPELPEIETYKNQLNDVLPGKVVSDVVVAKSNMLKGITDKDVIAALKGQELICQRCGKFLLLNFKYPKRGKPGMIAFHLGLRGKLRFVKKAAEYPEFHIRITFQDGSGLIYQTLFGSVHLAKNNTAFLQTESLGPDAITFSKKDFKTLLTSQQGNLKAVLMDQHLIAGLGNVYTDELLFQAKLDPKITCKKLTPLQIDNLYDLMRAVLETGIQHAGHWRKFPESYLSRHRKGDGKCPRDGGPLQEAKVAGRTSHYCPRCQKAAS